MTFPSINRYRSPLGVLIVKELDERGISQRQGAFACGIQPSSFNAWISGGEPKVGSVPVLSAFCRVPARVILEAVGLEVDRTYEFDDIPGYHRSRRTNTSITNLVVAA